jgi:long-chain acyl-CoA synthetase
MNISRQIESVARLFPASVAIHYEGTDTSYSALQASIAGFAAGLRQLGVRPGERVAIILPNIPEFAIAYYAVLSVGAVVVSMNSRSTQDEIRFILNDSTATAVVTVGDLRGQVPDADSGQALRVIVADGARDGDIAMESRVLPSSTHAPATDRERHDPAVILYTSGTTGAPKGATLSHGNIVSNVWSFVHNCGFRVEDRILLQLPLFHCFGQNALLNSSLFAGATIVLQRTFRPETALRAVEERAVTMLFAVPTMFATLLERATPGELRSVRYFFSAAASLPVEVERRWHEKFGRVIHQGYGLTETSPFASYNHAHQYRLGSIGMPIENVEIRIVDVETGLEAPPDTLGEIAIKGPNVMLGYWNRPEDTARSVRNGWFHSGDIGFADRDGYLYIVDRLKDMIDVGGMNVYPVEVENALYGHWAVGEAAVFGVPDPLMGERVCAAVVLKLDAAVTADQLAAHCGVTLADFKVPRSIEFLTELPRNPSGKILKRVLRQRAPTGSPASNSDSLAAAYYAADGAQGRLVLREYLHTFLTSKLELSSEQIDPREPLTDLGLESLMAVDMAARIRGDTGLDVTALSLASGATLEDVVGTIAAELDRARAASTRER